MRSLLLALLLLLLVGCTQPNTPQYEGYGDNEPVLYAFTWSGCVPCQRDKPRLTELASRGHLVVMYEYDNSPEIFKHYSVELIPTYIVYQNGQELYRVESLDDVHL
jgi:thiol-disulfide isomerase/thioredoxin